MRNPRIPQVAILVRPRQPIRTGGIPGIQTVLISLDHPYRIAMDPRQRGRIQRAVGVQQTLPGDPPCFRSEGEDLIELIGLALGGPGDGSPGFAEHRRHLPLKVAPQGRA
jgi:hypothetical protein